MNPVPNTLNMNPVHALYQTPNTIAGICTHIYQTSLSGTITGNGYIALSNMPLNILQWCVAKSINIVHHLSEYENHPITC